MQTAVPFLPQMGWSLPLTIQHLESRILKTYSLSPNAVETPENIAAHWLAGENVALVREALDELARRGTLVRTPDRERTYYSLLNRGLAGEILPPADNLPDRIAESA